MLQSEPLVVLLSSAGRRVDLIQCFRADAAELQLQVRILAVDSMNEMSAACHVADESFTLPRCTDPAFLLRLLELCAEKRVNLLVPTIDTELLALAEHRREFAEIGTHVAVSSPEMVRLARNKLETYRFLTSHGIPAPRTALLPEALAGSGTWRWPILVKPIAGSSSRAVEVVNDAEEARVLARRRSDYIAQEFWEGREYTVNVFFDRESKLRAVIPHLRYEIRSGEVSKAVTERQPALIELGNHLAGILPPANGPLCFQAIVTRRNDAAVFEINARFGGGYPLAHRAGARFSKWLLEDVAGLPSSASDQWEEGVVMLRYDAGVYCNVSRKRRYAPHSEA